MPLRALTNWRRSNRADCAESTATLSKRTSATETKKPICGVIVMPGLLASTSKKTTLPSSVRAAQRKLVAAWASKTNRLVPFMK